MRPRTVDRPSVAKPASRPRSRKAATISASALALLLDCSRTYIGKLQGEGVIQRQGDGFPLDHSRVLPTCDSCGGSGSKSQRSEADADHIKIKTEMLQLLLMEKKRELVRLADVDALIDGIAAVTLTALSSLPARCAPRSDLAVRRSIERVLRILSGQDTEPGTTVFSVFASTLVKVHEPIFSKIDFEVDIDGRRARLVVPGLIETRGEPILNPVTGNEHRVRIDMVGGFEYTLAEIGRGWSKASGPISYELADSYGQFAHIHLSQSGIVH